MGDDRHPRAARAHVPAGSLQHALGSAPVPALDRGAGDRPLSAVLLYSDTGGGHRAAATALSQALQELEAGIEITLADPLIAGGSPTVSRLASLYSPLTRYVRPLWGLLFHASNTPAAFAGLHGVFAPAVGASLAEALQSARPDVVVSVHPLLNQVALEVMREHCPGVPFVVVVTDLGRFHRGWRCPEADLTVVPTEEARAEFVAKGVLADRIRVRGLPVNRSFRPPAPGERSALRRVFGLREDLFTILMSGGGEGAGNLEQQVEALARRPAAWQLIVVCARNLRLQKRLRAETFAVPVLVLGFVENMADLMRAADLAVGKAGPGAIAEALATGIPMVVTSYLPGQESANIDYVKRLGVGRYAPARRLRRTVEAITADDNRLGQEMAARAQRVARPFAVLEIADECRRLAQAYRAASQGSR